jgi:hypothetical protein
LETHNANVVADSSLIANNLNNSTLDVVQREEENRVDDGFEDQCQKNLLENLTSACTSEIIDSPKSSKEALPITIFPSQDFIATTHSFTNEDYVLSDTQHSINDDTVRNREFKLVPWTGLMQPCLSYDRQNVPTQSPPPKPPDGTMLKHFLPLEPPNGVDIQNHLMLPPPLKPPDPSFQSKQGEFQVT